jgi:glycosyltransferase involved in cell wall biosynthesis
MKTKKVDKLDLSVVVITQNESLVIEKCIKSIIIACNKNYAPEEYEIILVDSMSKDNTVGISKTLLINENVKNWTIIQYKSINYTAALGREIGKETAKGEYILFLDGDMLLFSNFLKFVKENKMLFESNIAGLIGNRIDAFYNRSYKVKNLRKFNRKLDKNNFTTHPGGGLFLNIKNVGKVKYNFEQKSREEEAFAKKLLAEGRKIKYTEQNMYLHLNYKQSKRNLLKRISMVKDVSQSYVIAIKSHYIEYGLRSIIKHYFAYFLYYIVFPLAILMGMITSFIMHSLPFFMIFILISLMLLFKEKLNSLNVVFFLSGLSKKNKTSYEILDKFINK